MAKVQYLAWEEVRLQGLVGVDGYVSLSIEDAKKLHGDLSAILYGTPNSPKQVK